MLVSFTGSVIESTSIQTVKNFRRAEGEHAMECVFAEYQKELLEQYEIFALEAGYETDEYQKKLLDQRLEFYGLENFNTSIERLQFLSDDSGRAFFEQAVEYMKHKYGMDFIGNKLEMVGKWKENDEVLKDYQKEEEQNKISLDNLLAENEMELPEEDNPISYVNLLKDTPVLKLVMPEGNPVSGKRVQLTELPSHRKCNTGKGDFSDKADRNGTVNKLLFGEYLLEQFNCAVGEEGGVLEYEIEYMIAGKENDRENLQSVVNRLLMLRFASNYAYLQTSSSKRAEAQMLAVTLSSLLSVPAITEAVTQGILFSWAFGESVVDIRSLLDGGKVPFIKNNDSWQLSISGLLKLGELENINDGSDCKDGHEYKEYLRILLFLENQEEISMRALDLVEQNLQNIHGLELFCVDNCITKLEMEIECALRRNISYTFPVGFGYL